MKIIKRTCAFFLAFLLVGCGNVAAPTEPVETAEPIVTQAALEKALATTAQVEMGGDIQLRSGVTLESNVLVGNGYQLLAPTYDENAAETTASIFLVSGNVENIVLNGGNRSMTTDPNHRMLGHIRLTNVVSSAYSALYVGHGDNEHNLDAVHCEFYGKTVFSRIAKAYFADCTFGYNTTHEQGCVWAYRDARFVNCRFEGMGENKFQLIIPKEESNREVIFENCYVGDTLITEDNIEQLLKVNNQGSNTIRVSND